MMELWIATTNRGKLLEFEMILEPLIKEGKLKLKTLGDLDTYFPPDETGATFLDNARIKARSLKSVRPGAWIVAEDSGLAVEGMNGLPAISLIRVSEPTKASSCAHLDFNFSLEVSSSPSVTSSNSGSRFGS